MSPDTKHICIVTQSHLSRNPRVVKEALSLAEAGFRVTIINSTYDDRLGLEDRELIRGYNIKTMAVAVLEKKNLATIWHKIAKKAGDRLVSDLSVETPLALGYACWQYRNAALKQSADLYLCHQELGLYCGVQLLGNGKKVAFDLEDWYSEDLSVQARRSRPLRLLKKLESFALNKGLFCYTTSNIMAREMAAAYGSPLPETIYNTFDPEKASLSAEKQFTVPLKLFWFSQTIGPHRGIEEFLRLAGRVTGRLEIHLLGNVSEPYKDQLTGIQDKHPVLFHPQVPAHILAAKIADFDIGLALEQTTPRNTDLTISNKLFQYVQSGLPVIVTATSGQSEIFNKNTPGFLISDYQDPQLAAQLQDWLKDPVTLGQARGRAIRMGYEYTRHTEYQKLIQLIDRET